RRGRLAASLEVPSMPCEVSQSECAGLVRLAHDHRITSLALQTYGSPEGAGAQCSTGDIVRRTEFVWMLPREGELIEGLSRTHRERARKAQKAGAVVSQLAAEEAMSALRRLHAESLDRREARGEHVARGEFAFGD